MTIYEKLFRENRQKGVLALLDPDRIPRIKLQDFINGIGKFKEVKGFLVGTSLLISHDFDNFVKKVKSLTTIPVLIFPGSSLQISPYADAILFLSLVSGRNPELLIGEHVKAAPLIKKLGIEVIPTGYILIESGRTTAVEFMSNTKPIPREKPEIAVAHAIAAELLGMKLIYLEAGSGAPNPVPPELVRKIREEVSLPILVGGGIRNRKDVEKILISGADYVVIGTQFEVEFNLMEVGN